MPRLSEQFDGLVKDRKITANEVEIIRQHTAADGRLDLEDMKFLVELLAGAKEVCPEFDALFFPALKQIVLEDGHISQGEQFYLLKMLYSDGEVRDSERQFLQELCDEAGEVPPEFTALVQVAMQAESTNWSLD
jgi:hypothetical protein